MARLIAGLTLAQVGRVAAISATELSRIERGKAPWVTVASLNRFAAAVGIDIWTRTYPGGEPLRDIAHIRLSDAFHGLLGEGLLVRAEVQIGDPRDLRAWDLTLTEAADRTCGVELETRFLDAQDQLRRLNRKVADGGLDRVLLVLADTRANRRAVQAASGLLSTTFAIDDPGAYAALAAGRIPPRDALIFVRVPARRTNRGVGRSRATSHRTDREGLPVPRHTDRQQADLGGSVAVPREIRDVTAVARDK